VKQKLFFIKNQRDDGIDGTFRPQLTSLIDVMTILLVFLIKSFSVEGHLITPSPDLELPVSTSEKEPKSMLSIEITKNEVLSDGEHITDIDAFAESDSLIIPLLFDWMLLQKSNIADTLRSREVLIQSDREIEFNIVKRVMYTCSRAGFVDFSVLVLQEEQ
jgi:biopolymer transport protein ExbD